MTLKILNANWNVSSSVHALTTLRTSGVSTANYGDFNLAVHQNRLQLIKALALPNSPAWLQQVHGNQVVLVEATDNRVADASYSQQQGLVCAVMTADCLPIVLCNPQGQCIAGVHAGWRGLLKGVIENTVTAMAQNQLVAWLAPAIGACCFEVGDEVKTAFVEQSTAFEIAFQAIDNQKYLADIYCLATIILNRLGVNTIYRSDYCTMCDSQKFYSYRRDGKHTGRMATLIWMDES